MTRKHQRNLRRIFSVSISVLDRCVPTCQNLRREGESSSTKKFGGMSGLGIGSATLFTVTDRNCVEPAQVVVDTGRINIASRRVRRGLDLSILFNKVSSRLSVRWMDRHVKHSGTHPTGHSLLRDMEPSLENVFPSAQLVHATRGVGSACLG